MADSDILIQGAREHNLRDVRLVLPRNRLICFTGVSGSGKSSLAFDTLYAEGQRRYVESLSSFARQFLGQMPKPDVDLIAGLSPSISISQKSGRPEPPLDRRHRSRRFTTTCGCSMPGWARGIARSAAARSRPRRREQIIERIAALPARHAVFRCWPRLIRGQKGDYRDLFEDLLKQGFVRARVDGRVVRLSDDLRLDRQMRHDIEVVVDRLVAGPKLRPRLAEAVELALRLGDGNLIVADGRGRRRKAEGGRRKGTKAEGGGRRAEDARRGSRLRCPPPSAIRLPPYRPRPPPYPSPPTTPARTAR